MSRSGWNPPTETTDPVTASGERPAGRHVILMRTCLCDTMNFHAIDILRDTMPIPA